MFVVVDTLALSIVSALDYKAQQPLVFVAVQSAVSIGYCPMDYLSDNESLILVFFKIKFGKILKKH